MTAHSIDVSISQLESRRHLAGDYAVLSGSTLYVTGTPGDDWCVVIERNGTYRAYLNDANVVSMFPVASVSLLIVDLGEGDDIGGFLAGELPVRAFGGPGNDALHTGSGADRIEGGTGNDSMWAGAGTDRLYGNEGDDRLVGDPGRDYLYGGEGIDTNHQRDNRDRVISSLEIVD